jgi:hypothetical protein
LSGQTVTVLIPTANLLSERAMRELARLKIGIMAD